MFKRNQIWKLQRPLVTGGANTIGLPPMILAYTEGKERIAQIPMPEEMLDEIFGDELKVYVWATVKNGVLKVARKAPEQDW